MTVRLATIAVLAGAAAASGLLPRAYQDTVCKPPTQSGPTPPCLSIEEIEAVCQPSTLNPTLIAAHAACMCKGSYFADWVGCRRCLFVHGLLSERELAGWVAVASTVSSSLCANPSPTVLAQSIFAAFGPAISLPATGATTSSDQFPSRTDVSLYYTPSGTQGPGPVASGLGGAAGTPTDAPTEPSPTKSFSLGSGGSVTTPPATSSTATSGARETGAPGMGAVAAAGILLAAVL